jgi:hypothetical protein
MLKKFTLFLLALVFLLIPILFIFTVRRADSAPISVSDAALAVRINQARICEGLTPLRWNDDLWQAASVLSLDGITRDCFGHTGCRSGSVQSRLNRYYPGWFGGGETIAIGLNEIVPGWLSSASHRAILLGPYIEFGTASINGATNFGNLDFATGDFGYRGLFPTPVVPTILGSRVDDEYLVSYWGVEPPEFVRVSYGTSVANMTLVDGTPERGIYATAAPWPAGCLTVRFEARSLNGQFVSWPSDGLDVGDACQPTPFVLERMSIAIGPTLRLNVRGAPVQPTTNQFTITYPGGSFQGDLQFVRTTASTYEARATYRQVDLTPTGPGKVEIRIGNDFYGSRYGKMSGKILRVSQ